MTNDFQSRAKAIAPATLSDVVRKDQRSPQFEITEWSVDRLSDQGIINPDGLWLYKGQGYDQEGQRSWSVVLKILQRQEKEPPPSSMWSWKREYHLAQSGFLEDLPGPVRAPCCYRADETPDGAWLWLEHIQNHRPDPWGLDDFAFAALQLGKWNGAIVAAGRVFDELWLTRQHYFSWYMETNPERDFQFPLNQKYITGDLRERYDQLWADRKIFYDTLEALPKTFSHLDSQRRNLMIRKGKDGQDELVLIDWAQCGLAPLGAELNNIVTMSAALFEWPPSAVAELDAAAFGSYLQGLREAGWSGEADAVRLAFTTWTAIWLGVVFPNITALWCTPDFRPLALQWLRMTEEELYLGWMPVFTYALDCADEARQIMRNLEVHNMG